ncbi:MAG: carbonic anhydrase, partial [Rhizomicrobium sp.]
FALTSDPNCLSVLQFAVETLKVRDVIVAGHYDCGGIAAAIDGKPHGEMDRWLKPIREVATAHYGELDAITDPQQRHDRLCELNVVRQVKNTGSSAIVQRAWASGQRLSLHGWVYALATGRLKDLEVSVRKPEELAKLR